MHGMGMMHHGGGGMHHQGNFVDPGAAMMMGMAGMAGGMMMANQANQQQQMAHVAPAQPILTRPTISVIVYGARPAPWFVLLLI
jgi:hypothetical protein